MSNVTKIIACNRKATHNFLVKFKLEAGIVLNGFEVKSVRSGKVQIDSSFIRIEKRLPVMYGSCIDIYRHNTNNNISYNPLRPRILLLHKQEIFRLDRIWRESGYTIIPLKLYFKKSLIKIEIGLCKGKRVKDYRQILHKRVAVKDMDDFEI